MSEPNATANAEQPPANAEAVTPEQKPVTQEDLLNRLSQLEQTNQRLLQESKSYKQSAQDLKKEKEERERKTAEEQGKYKELYEANKNQLEEFKAQMLRTKVESVVSEAALKAGCVDKDALLRLGNPDLLRFDEERGVVEDVDLFIEDARKNRPYLFGQAKQATINPAVPSAAQVVPKTLSAAEVAKLPEAEKRLIWGEKLSSLPTKK